MTIQYTRQQSWKLWTFVLLAVAARCSSSAFSLTSISTSTSELHPNEWPSKKQRLLINDRRVSYGISDTQLVRLDSLRNGGDQQPQIILGKINAFAQKNLLIVGMVVAVIFARLYPFIGKNGGIARPELFIGKFGVAGVFLLSGLSLEVSELKEAFSNLMLNASIQALTFLIWPLCFGLPFTWTMNRFLPNFFSQPLLDGILILTCLPTTVNMCVFLTGAAGGNVASALCNAVISNMLGIILTPALLLRFFGTQVQLPFLEMVWKLVNKVMLPVALGQALRKTKAKQVYETNSKFFKKIQEGILVSIVWNAFCEAFSSGWDLPLNHAMKLILMLSVIHLGSLRVAFKLFESSGCLRGDVIAAMFCSSHKTLAFGLPLVNTVFEGNPNLAAYCAPLMVIHPLQLLLGSLLLGRLEKYSWAGS